MKRIVFYILTSILIGFASVALINSLYRRKMDLVSLFSEISPRVVVVAFSIFAAVYLVEAFRLMLVLRAEGYRISLKDSIYNNVVGYLFSFLTPSATGGQPFQIYHMSKLGVDSGYATSVMASRFLEIAFGNTLVSILTLKVIKEWIKGYIVFAGILVNVSIALLTLLATTKPQIMLPLIRLTAKLARKPDLVDGFKKWGESLRSSIKKMWSSHILYMMVDIAGWFVVTALFFAPLYYIYGSLIGWNADFLKFFGVCVTVSTLAYFIPTPGSSGGFEAVYTSALSQVFGGGAKAVSVVFAWRLSTYYLQIFLGLVVAALWGRWTDVRRGSGG